MPLRHLLGSIPGFASRTWRLLAGGLAVVLATAVAAEVIARTAFGLLPLAYTRQLQPVLVSGHSLNPTPREALADLPGGPVSLGYEPHALAFVPDPDVAPANTATPLTDFLFDHNLARYSGDDVDRILCGDPGAVGLYVLGGSAARGSSATHHLAAWHARLEARLRRDLQRQDIYVFNAAMGGFRSYQEKLAYHLAVAPRPAGPVLVLNGFNDLATLWAIRPGDPAWMPTMFGRLYGNGLVLWLAEQSAIANQLLQNAYAARVQADLDRVNSDDATFRARAAAAVDIYLESMSEVLAACELRGTACLVALQPARALNDETSRTDPSREMSDGRVREAYALLRARLAESPFRDRFLDLAAAFGPGGLSGRFVDSVHLDNAGQQMMADALFERTSAMIASQGRPPPLPPRCKALPALRLLLAVPLDRARAMPGARLASTPDGLQLRADPRQYYYSAELPIPRDLTTLTNRPVIRVRLGVRNGDVLVTVVDTATGRDVAEGRPVRAGPSDVEIHLPIRGRPHAVAVIFKKEEADEVPSEAVIKEVSVLGR